ncbi:MAG TPA: DUF6252 family protein [Chitinophagales bacterium]|nr:DUF6252 family protein [Chitinophagales bacterium]
MNLTKLKKGITMFLALALIILASCHHGDDNNSGNGSCPGTVIATWKVDGTSYSSSTSEFIDVSTAWGLVLVACSNDGHDRSLAFNLLPLPLTPGTYPLQYKSGHGELWNNTGSGTYIISNGGDTYYTDTTGINSTGTITVTSVDTVNKKFSGGFSFHATNDAGTETVNITDGVLNNVNYQ